ncbi:MAG: class I SAM-dependent methyltransferase [Bacteroidia bacterium]
MQSNNIIDVLENDEALSFIDQNINGDIAELSLKYAGKVDFDLTVCLQLIDIYRRSKKKLPHFLDKKLAIDKRSYEQCTSEAVAKYKASFITGDKVIDITGGIGVDSLYLSESFEKVKAIERNEELHKLAVYNIEKLEIKNVERILGDGPEYLDFADWIYIDPDRRNKEIRSVALHNLEPNVLDLLPSLRLNSKKVYLKLSPLFDITMVWRVFEEASEVHLIAERGEIKELGVVLDFENDVKTRFIHTIDVHSSFQKSFEYDSALMKTERATQEESFSNLLIPNSLLVKSQMAFRLLDGIFSSKHKEFDIFFSDIQALDGFRVFEILNQESFAVKGLRKQLKKRGVNQLNILIKGLNQKAETWHKKLGTKDGGDYYLVLLKSDKSQSYLCRLISS